MTSLREITEKAKEMKDMESTLRYKKEQMERENRCRAYMQMMIKKAVNVDPLSERARNGYNYARLYSQEKGGQYDQGRWDAYLISCLKRNKQDIEQEIQLKLMLKGEEKVKITMNFVKDIYAKYPEIIANW